ncbi:MAG: succinate dehydrogenase [Epsilonproteobacteria bacterium]|nr:MAG: succinate dehydrogenase [Campylobacterota bacterium]
MNNIDILIVGAGGAGLSTAIEAKRAGLNVTVVSKTQITASQTCQAQGGINAVLDDTKDSIKEHIADTLKSAHGIGNEESIKYMCENAKESIEWLNKLAVPFSRDEQGNIAQRKLGGTKNKRACYSSDYTGLKILHTLFDTCLKEDIEFLEEYMLLDLIVERNTIKGIVALDICSGNIMQILAKKVVLATGGYAGIYTNYNTNSYATTGDGVASMNRVNGEISNMEYVQFHPTALKGSSILISESARGEGGYLVTKDGIRFIDELKPRDEVARAIYEKIQNGNEIYLDVRHLGYERILHLMPQEYNLTLQYTGLRMDEDLIPISPAAHYSMGGILTSKDGQTSINNLFAVGECSNNGVHGANRLGGNSLLEIIVFGRLVGQNINNKLDEITFEDKEYEIYKYHKEEYKSIMSYPNEINLYTVKEELGKILFEDVGLFREQKCLKQALNKVVQYKKDKYLMGLGDKGKLYNTNLKEFYELQNMIELSILVIQSALEREESRGAHYRIDYKNENSKYNKPTVMGAI